MSDNKKTRRERFFVYNDGTNVVLGTAAVRYEPSIEKNVYGSTSAVTYFPRKKELKHSFRLDLYPTVIEKPHSPVENITGDIDEGCANLFIESNRAAALLIRSICEIPADKFSYKHMRLLEPEEIHPNRSEGAYVVTAVITKNHAHLRKGDKIAVGELTSEIIDGKEVWRWVSKYDPNKAGFKFWEPARKLWMKLFCSKSVYINRYKRTMMMELPANVVKITSGKPVEDGTDRGGAPVESL